MFDFLIGILGSKNTSYSNNYKIIAVVFVCFSNQIITTISKNFSADSSRYILYCIFFLESCSVFGEVRDNDAIDVIVFCDLQEWFEIVSIEVYWKFKHNWLRTV